MAGPDPAISINTLGWVAGTSPAMKSVEDHPFVISSPLAGTNRDTNL